MQTRRNAIRAYKAAGAAAYYKVVPKSKVLEAKRAYRSAALKAYWAYMRAAAKTSAVEVEANTAETTP